MIKRVVSLLVIFAIVLSVVFNDCDTVKATGLEEAFYYTYLDLISGLYAQTGYELSFKDEYYAKPERASGKDVWDNFCTWVERKAQVLALPVRIANDTVYNELKDLPNVVTSAGATMSEELSEFLANVLPATAADIDASNQFDTSSVDSVYSTLLVLTSAYSDFKDSSYLYDVAKSIVRDDLVLNIVCDSVGRYIIFLGSYNSFIYKDSGNDFGPVRFYDSDNVASNLYAKQTWVQPYSESCHTYTGMVSASYWVVRNGVITGVDGTTLSDYAVTKTLKAPPDDIYVDGVGWKTNWDIWKDIILPNRVTTDEEEKAWESRYDFENDNDEDKKKKKEDNEKDKLPVSVPVVFPTVKPSEKDTEEDTEKDSEKDNKTDGKKNPVKNPVINPETGNVVDPETGYDIDSETGKLIDPKTGKLIDRDMTNTSSKLLKYGDIRKIFPFCIPFDIVDMIRGLRAEKAPPVFKFEHYFKSIDYMFTFNVDLSEYNKYIKLFRGGMVIFFVLTLMWLTVKVSKFFS